MTAGSGAAMYSRWVQALTRRWLARIVLVLVPCGVLTGIWFVPLTDRIDPFGRVHNLLEWVGGVVAWFAFIIAIVAVVVFTVLGVADATKWLWREAFHQNDNKKGWWS